MMDKSQQSIVNGVRDLLMEHFDSVRIFVTKYEGSGNITGGYTTGAGNFYAQTGQVTEWKAELDETTRKSVNEEQ